MAVLAKADPSRPYKAVVAFLGTFLVSLFAALQDKTELDTMSVNQWILVILGALVSAAVTYGVPNPIVPKVPGDDGGVL